MLLMIAKETKVNGQTFPEKDNVKSNSSMIIVMSQRFYVKQKTQICSKLIKKSFGMSI